ncbi:nucleoside monophosphate kinase [Patescibacteria group bacterium]|nr:nucleoside monophosphate kinase [Patescibacteria group bacterium]MBU1123396.1 nucleoside monophosphate kinase [Patescibacteria group bacterium]MBU1911444.1 nucleoside monophosphate kinase [Patescibacteria group bacterium]
MDLVFFGVQGSGKGTQAKRLAKEFGYSIFEAGGELRKIKASGSDLGEEVKSYIDIGQLVPFEIIMRVTKEAVLDRPADMQILFDGIPRDEDQMREFNKIMEEVGREFKCVEIKISKEEAVKRILGRAEKEGRADDADESVVLKRIGTFEEKTVPVIEVYKSEGKMIEVDGVGTVEEVYGRLKESLTR